MPDSSEPLAVARLLSNASGPDPLSNAQMRRAVSTAYYALFHKVLRAAAERFMGPGQENASEFSLLYRSFDHHQMRNTCESLRVSTLKESRKRHLGRTIQQHSPLQDGSSRPRISPGP